MNVREPDGNIRNTSSVTDSSVEFVGALEDLRDRVDALLQRFGRAEPTAAPRRGSADVGTETDGSLAGALREFSDTLDLHAERLVGLRHLPNSGAAADDERLLAELNAWAQRFGALEFDLNSTQAGTPAEGAGQGRPALGPELKIEIPSGAPSSQRSFAGGLADNLAFLSLRLTALERALPTSAEQEIALGSIEAPPLPVLPAMGASDVLSGPGGPVSPPSLPREPALLVVARQDRERGLLTIELTKAGCRVLAAGTAGEALRRLRLHRIDAIVFGTDLGLEDGGRICRAIEKDSVYARQRSTPRLVFDSASIYVSPSERNEMVASWSAVPCEEKLGRTQGLLSALATALGGPRPGSAENKGRG